MTGQEIISKLSLENGRIAKRTAAYELMNPSRPSSTEILYLIHNLLGSELEWIPRKMRSSRISKISLIKVAYQNQLFMLIFMSKKKFEKTINFWSKMGFQVKKGWNSRSLDSELDSI